MWLAVDSGNTRVKWALMEGTRIVQQKSMIKTRLVLPPAQQVRAVRVAHVGNASDLQRLQKALAGWRQVRFLKSRAFAGGVSNHYQSPAQLGVDRWLCLLAANHLTINQPRGVVVVSAGTAITVDVLSATGTFLGGVILPGLSAMTTALKRSTPLPAVNIPLPVTHWQGGEHLPQNTKAAMVGGVLLAAVGAILTVRRHYCPGGHVLLTGGDAAHLKPHLPTAQIEAQLIFHGMACLYHDNNSKRRSKT